MKQIILYLASLADISKDVIFLRLICLDLRVHYSRHLFSRWPLTHTGENQTWRGFKVLKSKSNSDTLITQKHIIWYFVPHREHHAFNVHFAMWQHVSVYREQSVVFQFNFLRCDLKYLGVRFHHMRLQCVCQKTSTEFWYWGWGVITWRRYKWLKNDLLTSTITTVMNSVQIWSRKGKESRIFETKRGSKKWENRVAWWMYEAAGFRQWVMR